MKKGLFIITVLLGFVFVNRAEEKRPKYEPLSVESLKNQFEVKAVEIMIDALKTAKFAAQLEEAIYCPCYDVEVSTKPKATIIRIYTDRCEKLLKNE